MLKHFLILLFILSANNIIYSRDYNLLCKNDCTIDSLLNSGMKSSALVNCAELSMPNTTDTNRIKFRTDLISKTIIDGFKKALNDSSEVYWIHAMNGMEFALYKDDFTFKSLKEAFSELSHRSLKFQRQLLETVYCLYPKEFSKEVEKLTRLTGNPKIFAMGINYLIRIKPNRNKSFVRLMSNKFADWKNDPILMMLEKRISGNKFVRPGLTDLLANTFEKGTFTVFSLQRKNRDYPGITIVRGSDGKFVRTADGNIFHISELARSISNLPCYLTNGNTPQGIFSIQGTDVSKNEFIGRTPNIQIVLPFEVSREKYFHNSIQNDTSWFNNYKNLLPESWKEYLPAYEAFFAGKAGRSEIIMHGTTIDPEFYSGKPYYPNSPTFGCLSAKEIWDGATGKCLISDQAQLVNTLNPGINRSGYLVVIELDDKNQPVTLDEILIELLNVEKRRENLK